MNNDTYQECYNRALFLLGRRAYSSHKLRQKLLQTYDAEIVNQCIRSLIEKKYLDDEIYLENRWKQNKNNGYGDKLLSRKYLWDGFSKELVEKVYKYNTENDDEYKSKQVMDYLMIKKKSLLKNFHHTNPNYLQCKNKIFRHLIYKGHSPSFAEKILKILTATLCD